MMASRSSRSFRTPFGARLRVSDLNCPIPFKLISKIGEDARGVIGKFLDLPLPRGQDVVAALYHRHQPRVHRTVVMTTGPTLRQIAWHEAGHAVVARDQKFTVTLVSIRRIGAGYGRSEHTPAVDCAIPSDRLRENIVALAGREV